MLSGAPYFASYVLKDTEAITTLFLVFIGPMLITMPAWVRLSRRYDKRGGMLVSTALFMGGGVAESFTPVFGTVYAHLCVAVVGVGFAGFQLLQFSMLADTLVYDELRSGKRRGGAFTGLWTATETVMMAFGALILGWVLAASGFVSSEPDKPVAQPDSAVNAILIGGALAPALMMAIAIALTLRYDLTAEQLKALRTRTGPVADAV